MSSGGLLRRDLAPVTVAALSTIALAAFDGVAVIAILPRITTDLGDVGFITWVITGFLVSSTVSVVVAGPVVDTLGVRTTFRGAVVLFTVASIACALAPNVLVLVVFRVAQGVAGGMVIAVSLAAVGLVYPDELVPRAYAAISAVWGLLAIVGPAVAAGMSTLVGWRSVFLVNVPLCAVAGYLAWNRFPSRRDDADALRFDTRGIVLLALFTVVSLVGVSSFTVWSAVAIVVSLVFAAAYWIHTGRVEAPVLERRFFARLPLSGIHLASAAVFGGCLGLNAYLPLYVQAGLDRSSGVAAASVLFLSLGWSSGSIGVSRLLTRVGAVDVAIVGFALILPALAIGMLVTGRDTNLALVWGLTVVQGLGVGVLSTSLLTYLQQQVDPVGMGRANAAHQYVRNLAYTYCAALVGAVVLLIVERRTGDVDAVRDLLAGDAAQTGAQTADAVADGFRWGHLVALVAVALGAIAGIALRRFSRRDLSPTTLPDPHLAPTRAADAP